jgi:predicted lipid-binding transport protein (Tim44 family)
MDRSMTQPGQIAKQPAAAGATAAAAQAARPSMMRNLLLGGLLGAGLATLFGAGAFANVLGFLLQGLLIAGVIYLAVMFFRNRFGGGSPAMASANAGRSAAPPTNANARQAAAMMGGSAPALNITGDDYSAFERILAGVQGSYSRGDVDALGNMTTSEMLSYFAGELEDNKRKGVRNELGAPTLLQGDLSEAWREAGSEYASVAMRYSLTDATIDTQSGKVVAGSTSTPDEVTEIWTFRRNPSAGPQGWELSAIQQA